MMGFWSLHSCGGGGPWNGRTLTHTCVNPQEPVPITPFHFITVDQEPKFVSMKIRWKMTQSITTGIRSRWVREYVPNLIGHRKWIEKQKN